MLRLEGVKEADVQFAASKVVVTGETTVQALEKAGAFENLKIIPEGETFAENTTPFWKKHQFVLLSLLLLIAAAVTHGYAGEASALSVGLYLAAIGTGGYSLFITGIKNIFSLTFDMKTLMTIAVIGAVLIGEWAEGAIVVILFAVSEALERYSMDKARHSIQSLMDLSPKEAVVRRGEQEMTISVQEVLVGDLVIVKPGQQIAADGEVVKGYSMVNQATITGESMPVEKKAADNVFAGTLNEEGMLEIRVTKRMEDTTMAKIIHLVEEAQEQRAPSQAFVDRFAAYYTPVIMLAALLVAVIPPFLFGAAWEVWIYQGLAVLVVGCPCALVISTPVSVVTAIGTAARHGVLIKGGSYLEAAGSLKAIAFDKTGTLTQGKPEVMEIYVPESGEDKSHSLSVAAALENLSSHPLAAAVVNRAEKEQVSFKETEVEKFQSITGRGVKGTIAGTEYHIGSPALFRELTPGWWTIEKEQRVLELQEKGHTVLLLGTTDKLLAVFSLADAVRTSSREMIQSLHRLGIKETIMLTGDNLATAEAIGRDVGVSSIQANLMPEDKVSFIRRITADHQKVGMVGDGVNDAPAMAGSTVGIAMGGAGTDTALETADIALMGDDLAKLPFAVHLSRRALTIIKQNIGFSLGLKVVALLLVIPGWLTLWIAIFADMGATLLVTLNALRLLRAEN